MYGSQVFKMVPVVMAVLILAGCGGNGGSDSNTEPAEPSPANGNSVAETAEDDGAEVPEPMQTFEDDGEVVEIVIEGNDRMQFNTDHFSIQPGQMVRLTLEHVGQLPAQSMGHNVVIVYPGQDPFDFGADVSEAGGNMDNDFVPESLRDRVVAFTAMIGGGETATVEFQGPEEPGEYPFLCSFPGHAGMMNGVMEVAE